LKSEAGGFRAFDFSFSVRMPSSALARWLDHVLSALASGSDAEHRYELDAAGRLCLDGDPLVTGSTIRHGVEQLLWHINQRAVASLPANAVLHAAAVSRNGIGVILPAPMESGKTTLATALVLAGFGYLTDEAVSFDVDSLDVLPFPKPLSIDRGAWRLFPELEPRLDRAITGAVPDQWQVAPDDIRPGATAASCHPSILVFPRRDHERPTSLVPIGRGMAVRLLAQNCFRFRDEGRRLLPVLADVARHCECYVLDVDDVDTAVELVTKVTDAAVASVSR